MSYGSLTWRPVRAEADIREDRVRIAFSEANLCGVSTLGTLTLDSAGPAIELAVSAAGETSRRRCCACPERRFH